MEHIRYKKETEVVTFQGKEITLENLSPVFTPEQEAAKRRELEQQLYEVFRKKVSTPPLGGYHRRYALIGPVQTTRSTGGFD